MECSSGGSGLRTWGVGFWRLRLRSLIRNFGLRLSKMQVGCRSELQGSRVDIGLYGVRLRDHKGSCKRQILTEKAEGASKFPPILPKGQDLRAGALQVQLGHRGRRTSAKLCHR